MDELSLRELASAAGVSPRTVRYYVAQGLLPGPSGAGPGARYSAAQLSRLRLIRQLQARHLPLAEIRERLAGLSDAEVGGLAEQGGRRVAESAVEYVRSVLREEPPAEPSPGQLDEPPLASPAILSGAFAPRAAFLRVPGPAPADADDVRSQGALLRRKMRSMPAAEPSRGPIAQPVVPDRSQWDRIALTPNVELHIRRPLGRLENRRVERLVSLARDVLKEDPE